MRVRPLPHLEPAATDAERELLLRRAERLRKRPGEKVVQAELEVAEFPAGGHTFAFELRYLQAAMPLRRVVPVPLAPAHLIGIVRYQGEVIPVLSLASVIGSLGWRQDPAVLVVLTIGGQTFGVDTEQVPRAAAYPLEAVDLARSKSRTQLTELVVGQRRVRLIEAAGLIAGVEGRHAP